MRIDVLSTQSFFVILICFQSATLAFADRHDNFIKCLYANPTVDYSISNIIYTPENSSYTSVLDVSIQNLRFINASKPLVIVTPVNISQVQATVACAKSYDLQIRLRSGGHDYEGLSYLSEVPFVILDMLNLRAIAIDVANATAWVQSGATVGELYYRIAERSKTLGFPAGVCPTVGVGGHFSGGGYGMMLRKYGLSADNVIDAKVVDVNGNILDREAMGEDLFWAIRGGGGGTFGVVVSWKIRLVPVPETVTGFQVLRTLDQNATSLVYKWQEIAAEKLPNEVYMRVVLQSYNGADGNRTIQAYFQTLYLGSAGALVDLLNSTFPEFGLTAEDCVEMPWINSTIYFAGFTGQPLEILLNRSSNTKNYFKNKSDYVKKLISEPALEEIWKWFFQVDQGALQMIWNPYGGRMSEISKYATPFPHRAGNLYKIQHITTWLNGSSEEAADHISMIRNFYEFMAAYVSKSPRSAYVNYRDLDIGVNNEFGRTSYRQGSVWGTKYFDRNFDRLVKVKTAVDPGNFFRSEQSIPPFSS